MVPKLGTRSSAAKNQPFPRVASTFGSMIKIAIIVALIRLLIVTGKPFLCSGIYVSAVLVYGLVTGVRSLDLLIATAVAFALGSLYFWLLDYLEDRVVLFWIIAVVGLLIGLV
jgi:hypothetical protein